MKSFGEHLKDSWGGGSPIPVTDWLGEFLPDWRRPALSADVLCPERPHISLCIPCMGRLYHLKETLPQNLMSAEADPDCDVHVLDYSSSDGAAEYLADQMAEIANGDLLKCFREIGRRYYSMPRAWNMLALTAEAGVLLIIGADFTMGREYLPALRRALNLHPGAIISLAPWVGMAAMTPDLFRHLGGYDLDMGHSYGHEDCDLLKRAVYCGAEEVWLPRLASVSHIPHPASRENMFKPDGGQRFEKMANDRLKKGMWRRNVGTGWENDIPKRMDGVYAC